MIGRPLRGTVGAFADSRFAEKSVCPPLREKGLPVAPRKPSFAYGGWDGEQEQTQREPPFAYGGWDGEW